MNASTRTKLAAIVGAAVLVGSLSAAPAASARPEPQPATGSTRQYGPYCSMERIGTQYVRCDDLTGAGVPAPSWIHEQTSAE
ncbi:hypothetical protein [Microbacterium ulmi]|uniref:Uncharacterized protein n=1 Tax=Microbacterium ulmi TaxID=179095 RepID=A0A7Y2LXW4_9MICO|nr:hypothetical protein [Microbacterium ulmi]NII70825.1 hypothetical protein [Microbacterium ulmi]NNH02841.1 hypothetical protein [Microbacterium ulmi]